MKTNTKVIIGGAVALGLLYALYRVKNDAVQAAKDAGNLINPLSPDNIPNRIVNAVTQAATGNPNDTFGGWLHDATYNGYDYNFQRNPYDYIDDSTVIEDYDVPGTYSAGPFKVDTNKPGTIWDFWRNITK